MLVQHRSTLWKQKNPEKNRAHALKNFHSFTGKISHVYAGMRQRVEGRGKSPHLYKGLALLDREDFIAWSLADIGYTSLHAAWVTSGYSMKLTPSIDRINSTKGYILENMQWVTHSENSRRAALQRHHGVL